MLAAGGLVEIIPHRGVFVSQLSVRATWEITSMRAILEPYAARLALEAAGPDAAAQAEVADAFRQLEVVVDAGVLLAVADADIGFHPRGLRPLRAPDAARAARHPSGPRHCPPARPDERAVASTARW